MPNKKHPEEERVNPLFANTSRHAEPIKTLTKPQAEKKITPKKPDSLKQQTSTPKPFDLPSAGVRHRRVSAIPFKEAYKQFTSFLDIELDKRFHALLADKGVTKTELFNEAIIDLLKKYGK